MYQDLHPFERCKKPRHSFFWDEHFLWRHVVGRVWLTIPESWRWKYVNWYDERKGETVDWCQLVNCAYLDIKKDDYECMCDVPLPWDAGAPRYGWCYCTPPEGWKGTLI